MTTAIKPTVAEQVKPPDLELHEITKRFGSLVAVDNVSMHLKPGTFHALLGENGAGKSTLVKCVMGFYKADGGEIVVDRQSRDIRSPHDAHKCGIGMVYQHFTLVPAMTVTENLVLSRADVPAVIDWKAERDRLATFLDTAPFRVDIDTPVSQLSAGEKQKTEILKQLYLQSRILILDEPTSVLTPDEADEVLGMLKQMVSDERLSILIITHKFREVRSFCDEVTVLRRGKFAGHGYVSELSNGDMAAMMLGEERKEIQLTKAENEKGAPKLELKDVRANGDKGVEVVKGINLTVLAGEIVGIAGVSGNGQRELVEVLAGQRPATGGQILVNGEAYGATRAEMAKHQIFLLPEEPLRNACVPHMSVAENMALRNFDRPPIAKGWMLLLQAMRRTARSLVDVFKVKTPSVDAPVGNLSGGNVQRTVLARELSGDPQILIAANPCFGLDFAAVDYIHSQLLEARNRGVAVLLVSEDLDELLALADRIAVIAGGRFTFEGDVATADIHEIGHCMAGH